MHDCSNVALVSHGAIWQPGGLTSARLKAGTLLFDRLLFVNMPEGSLPDYVTSFPFESDRTELVSEKSKKKLSNCWASTTGRAPTFSIYGDFSGTRDLSKWPWHSAPDLLKNSTKAIVERLYHATAADDSTATQAGYEAYKYGGYIMSEILYWRQFFSGAAFLGDGTTEEILRSVCAKDQSHDAKWSDVEVPGFDRLSWDDVAELRQSDYLKGFRNKFFELSREGRSAQLMDEYRGALERLADYCRPHIGRNAVLGILGNVPGLLINPISVGTSVFAVVKDLELRSQFGWVFFVRDLQRASGPDASRPTQSASS